MALEDWLPYFPELERNPKQNVLCPFHADTKPSFSVDVERNIAHCFGCGWSGDLRRFKRDLKEFDVEAILEERKEKEEKRKQRLPPFISLERVKELHKVLMASEHYKGLLKEKRLLSEETLEKFLLGLENDRITIPVFDFEGRCLNLRKYSFSSSDKYISERGRGSTTVFPMKNLENDPILFVEGEMDALLANQLGYNAVTLTTGASSSFPISLLDYIKGKRIYICYDLDEAGQRGAVKLRNSLSLFAKEVKVIDLPSELGKGGDFTDFFLQGHSKTEFDQLLSEELIEVKLEDLSLSKYWQKRVALRAKVSGKDAIPFLVPKKIRYRCNRNQGNKCTGCILGDGDFELELYPSNPIFLELIQTSKERLNRILRSQVPLPKKCYVEIEPFEYTNVESLRLLPADLFSGSGEYVTRQVYFMGAGIKTNAIYNFEGLVIPDPKTQYSTFLIEKAVQETGIFSQFQRKNDLRIFQSEDVAGKLFEIYRDFEHNVTQVFGRANILLAIDLAFFSPIRFYFAGGLVPKGWAEVLIVGDTRQGKSKTIQRICEHYQAGVRANSDACSVAGLKGGVAQFGRTWQLQWGLIPLNNRGLVVIDDLQNMADGVLPALSRVRSEGVAEVVKIEAQQTLAQTRLIWIANPSGNRSLSSYAYGIEAVADLVKQPSDIARFDLVVFAQEGEVDMTELPFLLSEKVKHIYTSELCKELLIWNWTRTPEQIEFDPEAEELIFKIANELVEKYKSPIPIVKSGEEHITIAKLAVAIAGRLFSTDSKEEKIIVFPRHVEFIKNFLEDSWDAPSCLYNEYAALKKKENSIEDPEEVREVLRTRRGIRLINDFLRYRYFQLSDIEDLFYVDRPTAKTIVSTLVRNRAFQRKKSYYFKTPAFIEFLKAWKEEAEKKKQAEPPF